MNDKSEPSFCSVCGEDVCQYCNQCQNSSCCHYDCDISEDCQQMDAKMNKHYKDAEFLIKKVIETLSEIVEAKGEDKDISCYGSSSLFEPINLLIKAEGSMITGRLIDNGWTLHPTKTGKSSSIKPNILNVPKENNGN